MGTPTYTAIASQTLTSSASSVTFSSIPGTFRDLVLVAQATTTGATTRAIRLQFNSDTGSNYSVVNMSGDGSSASSTTSTTTSFTVGPCAMTIVGQGIMQIMDYSATDKHKSVLTRNDNAEGSLTAYAQRWANTSAVTSIYLFPNLDSFAAGSTFSLYGVSA